jgi:hypothetical protein
VPILTESVAQKREELVRDHVEAENVGDHDAVLRERVYLDSSTILQQLGVARDPLSLTGRLGTLAAHPLTIGRGLVRSVAGR